MSLKSWIFPLFLVGIGVVALLMRDTIVTIIARPDELEAMVASAGVWGPVLLAIVQAFQVVVFVVPGEVVQIAAGYGYGIVVGALISLVGIAAGSFVNFFVGRFLGVPFLQAVSPRLIERYRSLFTGRVADGTIFLLFLIPGFPKDFLCYLAGVGTLSLPRFLLISMGARLPGILGSAVIGHGAASGMVTLALVMLIVAGVIGVVAVTLRRRIVSEQPKER